MTTLHLVGGFLGSGKTTAIIAAAKQLLAQGLQPGVITNDQGKYLVDTAFARLADLPAVEVGGGCFCCNYAALDERLSHLLEQARPDVIFAESVGSCADIVATVLKPLLELRQGPLRPASFSVFADSRLLLRRLRGEELPFSEAVLYIYDQQLDEAGWIVANKIDLLAEQQRAELRALLERRYPGVPLLLQNSLAGAGVAEWLRAISGGAPLALPSLPNLDYARYGAGEALLAWVDLRCRLVLPGTDGAENRARLTAALERLLAALAQRGAGVGHIKLVLAGHKLSLPTLPEPGWQANVPHLPGTSHQALFNARAELPAAELEGLLRAALEQAGIALEALELSAFHPAQPNPTHRIG